MNESNESNERAALAVQLASFDESNKAMYTSLSMPINRNNSTSFRPGYWYIILFFVCVGHEFIYYLFWPFIFYNIINYYFIMVNS